MGMFDFIIKNALDQYMAPLKAEGVQLTNCVYQNEDIVLATNLPTNYEAMFNSTLNKLKEFGIKTEVVNYKHRKALALKNLPKEHKKIIQSYIESYRA